MWPIGSLLLKTFCFCFWEQTNVRVKCCIDLVTMATLKRKEEGRNNVKGNGKNFTCWIIK